MGPIFGGINAAANVWCIWGISDFDTGNLFHDLKHPLNGGEKMWKVRVEVSQNGRTIEVKMVKGLMINCPGTVDASEIL